VHVHLLVHATTREVWACELQKCLVVLGKCRVRVVVGALVDRFLDYVCSDLRLLDYRVVGSGFRTPVVGLCVLEDLPICSKG